MKIKRPHLTFFSKSLLLLGIVQAAVVIVVAIMGLQYYRRELLEHASISLDNLTTALSISLRDAVINKNLVTLQSQIAGVGHESEVAYVKIVDDQGRVLAETGREEYLKRPPVLNRGVSEQNVNDLLEREKPIVVGGLKFGVVEMGMSLAHVRTDIRHAKYYAVLFCLVLIGIMLFMTSLVLMMVTRGVVRMKRAFYGLLQGDASFNTRMNLDGEDEFAQVGLFFDLFMGKLEEMVNRILMLAEGLATSSKQAQDITTETSNAVEVQARDIATFASHIERMAKSSEGVNYSVEQAMQRSVDVQTKAQDGVAVMEAAQDGNQQLVSGMRDLEKTVVRLAERHQDIQKALTMIVSVAEQTNLLALNAAIEAARAGEHGRGFAVVADEVRKLSRNTTEATAQIQTLLTSIETDSRAAVKTMHASMEHSHSNLIQVNEAGATFAAIAEGLGSIRRFNTESTDLAAQQVQWAHEIHDGIHRINTNIANLVAIARQSISDNSDLAQYSVQLAAVVSSGGNINHVERVQNQSADKPADDVELF